MISDSSSVLVGTEKGTIFLYNVSKNEFLINDVQDLPSKIKMKLCLSVCRLKNALI